jgi:hypothetical protein
MDSLAYSPLSGESRCLNGPLWEVALPPESGSNPGEISAVIGPEGPISCRENPVRTTGSFFGNKGRGIVSEEY